MGERWHVISLSIADIHSHWTSSALIDLCIFYPLKFFSDVKKFLTDEYF